MQPLLVVLGVLGAVDMVTYVRGAAVVIAVVVCSLVVEKDVVVLLLEVDGVFSSVEVITGVDTAPVVAGMTSAVELVARVLGIKMVVPGVLPSVITDTDMVVATGIVGVEAVSVEGVKVVLVARGGVEAVLAPGKLVGSVVLTRRVVNGVLLSLVVEIRMVVTSAGMENEPASVEVSKGVLVSPGGVESVLASEGLVTDIGLMRRVVNKVLLSLVVDIGMVVVPSRVVGDELPSEAVVMDMLVSTDGMEGVLLSGNLVTGVVLTRIVVPRVLISMGIDTDMVVLSRVAEDEMASVEVVTGVLVTTEGVERVLPSELVTCVVLTGIVVNGVLPSLGVRIGMAVPSGVTGDELTWVEVIIGVLVSTGSAEAVPASEMVTDVVLTGIMVNGVLTSLGVDIGRVITSGGVGVELL